MKNPLHKELEDLRYISISSIDPYDIPESVVIYFKNNSEINKKMSIETIHGTQLDLQNQNPTIVLENYKATFCLGSIPYVPTVTIDPVEDILNPEYLRKITFTGTVSRTDDYIPNDILVEYNGVTMRASLVDDTHWSVTYDLDEVVKDTEQVVSAIANSIDVNNPEKEGEFSLPVEETFKILFTVIDCIGSDQTTGLFNIKEVWDLIIEDELHLKNSSVIDIIKYLNETEEFQVTFEPISCIGATSNSGFLDINGNWDLVIDDKISLENATPVQIAAYLNASAKFEVTFNEN